MLPNVGYVLSGQRDVLLIPVFSLESYPLKRICNLDSTMVSCSESWSGESYFCQNKINNYIVKIHISEFY